MEEADLASDSLPRLTQQERFTKRNIKPCYPVKPAKGARRVKGKGWRDNSQGFFKRYVQKEDLC